MRSNDGINETLFVLRDRSTAIRQARRMPSYSFLHNNPSCSTVKTFSRVLPSQRKKCIAPVTTYSTRPMSRHRLGLSRSVGQLYVSSQPAPCLRMSCSCSTYHDPLLMLSNVEHAATTARQRLGPSRWRPEREHSRLYQPIVVNNAKSVLLGLSASAARAVEPIPR